MEDEFRCPVCGYTEQDARELMDHSLCEGYGVFNGEQKMNADESMAKFLTGLGARRRGHKYILDGFGAEFYLMFDAEPAEGSPAGTVHLHIAKVGASPNESSERICVLMNCTRHQVMRFMFALGVDRFSEKTKKFLYESNRVIRAT